MTKNRSDIEYIVVIVLWSSFEFVYLFIIASKQVLLLQLLRHDMVSFSRLVDKGESSTIGNQY